MITKTPHKDLTPLNTFRMKVQCALYVEVTEEADIPALPWDSFPRPVMVMGGGSNLLFTADFPGTVLHIAIGRGEQPEMAPGPDGEVLVTVGAGTVFDDFCAWAAREGLWGPENLSLIPGEAGASAVQNIGAYGVEAKDIIAGIRAWDCTEGRFVSIDPATCGYGYRTSKFKTEWKGRYLITAVTYRLCTIPQPKLDYGGVRKALEARGVATPSEIHGHPRLCKREGPVGEADGRGRSEAEAISEGVATPLAPLLIRETIIGIRKEKLPAVEEVGSAGSFFCNPVISREHFNRIVDIAREDNGPDCLVPHFEVGDRIKVPAAWMIDQCGFKGKRLGGAQVYPGQPLVIVNASGEALPEEIIGLETAVVRAIEAKYGITLHPEVEHI